VHVRRWLGASPRASTTSPAWLHPRLAARCDGDGVRPLARGHRRIRPGRRPGTSCRHRTGRPSSRRTTPA
jgi:hypothetical protein